MPSLASGEQLLHRLRHHVRGGVPQDVAAVGRVDGDRLDLGRRRRARRRGRAGRRRRGRRSPRARRRTAPSLRARRHRPLGALACVDNGDLDVGHGDPLLVLGCAVGAADAAIVSAGPRRAPAGFARGLPAKVPATAPATTEAAPGARRPRCGGGRYWVRTSDLFGVNEARYHCANRPCGPAFTGSVRRKVAHAAPRSHSGEVGHPAGQALHPVPAVDGEATASRRPRRRWSRRRPRRSTTTPVRTSRRRRTFGVQRLALAPWPRGPCRGPTAASAGRTRTRWRGWPGRAGSARTRAPG